MRLSLCLFACLCLCCSLAAENPNTQGLRDFAAGVVAWQEARSDKTVTTSTEGAVPVVERRKSRTTTRTTVTGKVTGCPAGCSCNTNAANAPACPQQATTAKPSQTKPAETAAKPVAGDASCQSGSCAVQSSGSTQTSTRERRGLFNRSSGRTRSSRSCSSGGCG